MIVAVEGQMGVAPVASAPRALLYGCRPGSYRHSREGREWLNPK